MKWNELKAIATKKGWFFVRYGKKHDVYLHPNRKDVLYIERHGSQEIRPGLYKRLKKQVGF